VVNSDQTTLTREAVEPVIRAISKTPSPKEGFTTLAGREMYCIPQFDAMPPFLMSIASDSDLWMYVSSTGALTCGRRSPEMCLFPYETDDRLHHLRGITGPITLIREDDATEVWEPFAGLIDSTIVSRNLYKSTIGNEVVFEETHHGLGLTFRYGWQNCDAFGFVRTATLINHSAHRSRSFEMIDGLLNVMPPGVQLGVQQGSSCLADAYKVCELDRATKLGVFSLNSLVTDRAEPAESLRANLVWCRGLSPFRATLSAGSIESFRRGRPVAAECKLRGQRGSYLVSAAIELKPGQALSWDIVADVGRTQQQVSKALKMLESDASPIPMLRESLESSRDNLARIVAANDGLQATADAKMSVHHFANVLFNTMRGGAFADGGKIRRADFIRSVQTRNKPVASKYVALLAQLPEQVSPAQLIEQLRRACDPSLLRLGYEYLPVTFGRRHGDPSRPWNSFNIQLRDENGSQVIAYQGNWRDIFQNWEALCTSFPEYITSIIAKFVSASTADGFNPYRVTHEGIDWEVPEPNHPWSNIGYWGDHQIVYLTRLLELSERFQPGTLAELLASPNFSYASVPYRIKPFANTVNDCRNTIEFEAGLHRRIEAESKEMGTDAKLLRGVDGAVLHVSLMEKLLVPVLAKMGSFVIGGGIWMHTQRPEWNDANNALAGYGLSVVTLCYMQRHVQLIRRVLESTSLPTHAISCEVANWLRSTLGVLQRNLGLTNTDSVDPAARMTLLSQLGGVSCDYRRQLYQTGIGQPVPVSAVELRDLLALCETFIAHTIRLNERPDGLFHSYNLIHFSEDKKTARVRHLPLMLEGQVAAISSGLLTPERIVNMVESLYTSELYRADQHSFTLYPDRSTKSFLEKNIARGEDVSRIRLLRSMLACGDFRVVALDGTGRVRFHADLSNDAALQRRLDEVARDPAWHDAVAADRTAVSDLYESVFEHHSFTGRSGSMFGYEGLGSIYWHMVAKLVVAVQEVCIAAERAGKPQALLGRLHACYDRVRSGLGFNKSARDYGAFPTDPYSHTPAHAGARQPGMTGQVKEEIISRMGEFGVRIEQGQIRFSPTMLHAAEFSQSPSQFRYYPLNQSRASIDLPSGALAFTFCQVPVVYQTAQNAGIVLTRDDGERVAIDGDQLSARDSSEIFNRSGRIVRIDVAVMASQLRNGGQKLNGAPSPIPVDINGNGCGYAHGAKTCVE